MPLKGIKVVDARVGVKVVGAAIAVETFGTTRAVEEPPRVEEVLGGAVVVEEGVVDEEGPPSCDLL